MKISFKSVIARPILVQWAIVQSTIINSAVKKSFYVASLALLLVLSACSNSSEPETSTVQADAATKFDVYKSPTCGCCKDWIDHLEGGGFKALVHHPSDLGAVKQQYGISSPHQSCHTAVSEQGYVFEGHIPVQLVKRFLANPPKDALGLTVPGMPFGSPGMEMGDRVDQYSVLVIYPNGRSEHFAEVKGAEVLND